MYFGLLFGFDITAGVCVVGCYSWLSCRRALQILIACFGFANLVFGLSWVVRL